MVYRLWTFFTVVGGPSTVDFFAMVYRPWSFFSFFTVVGGPSTVDFFAMVYRLWSMVLFCHGPSSMVYGLFETSQSRPYL